MQNCIVALEALAPLVLLFVRLRDDSQLCDNQAVCSATLKMLSQKEPLSFVLQALGCFACKHGVGLHASQTLVFAVHGLTPSVVALCLLVFYRRTSAAWMGQVICGLNYLALCTLQWALLHASVAAAACAEVPEKECDKASVVWERNSTYIF